MFRKGYGGKVVSVLRREVYDLWVGVDGTEDCRKKLR
jgi:hypothetical protein